MEYRTVGLTIEAAVVGYPDVKVTVKLNGRYVTSWVTPRQEDDALDYAEAYLASAFDKVLEDISGTGGIEPGQKEKL